MDEAHESLLGSRSAEDAVLAVARVLRLCHLHMVDALNAALQYSNISINQYLVLRSLRARPSLQASPSELARENGETASNTTRICDTLVMNHWARRVRSAGDRRRVDVSLTDAGVWVTEEVAARVGASGLCSASTLGAQDYDEISNVLLRLEAALFSARQEPDPAA